MHAIIEDEQLIIGIDLGTTYSSASVMLDNEIIMIKNSLGLNITPSYVCFLEEDKIIVGELAKFQPSYEYTNTIYNVKRLMGRNLYYKDIKEIIQDLTFDVKKDSDIYTQLKLGIKTNSKDYLEFYPEQISALILKKIVKDSEYYLSKKFEREVKIKKAVITVPAYFNQRQREATLQAAEIIDLQVERIINEPTAASLAYGYKSLGNENKLITVLDFGGGTLDLTLLNFIKDENGIKCDIKFSYGNTHFGGEDFDYILAKKCLESIGMKNYDKKLLCNIRLKRACEMAKIKLSTSDNTNIILEEYAEGININLPLTKDYFEKFCNPMFSEFENILKTFLKDCKYKDKDIAEVILIGGTTLMPKVQEIIKKVFKYSKIRNDLNPEETVAKGAAIHAAMLSKLPSVKHMTLLDVTNLSYGIKVKGDKMSKIIKRSSSLPEEASAIYDTEFKNQTAAKIEVYEGEDEVTENNLFLDEFIINNLPKMKKGEAKVKVKIAINNDSILKVTASDLQNEDNNKELEIKRPKGLRDKIAELKIKTANIKENEMEEYTQVKNKIIDLEEEILKTKEEKKIQEINAKLIDILAECVMNMIKKISQEKIAISYIRYYFFKVIKYLQIYQDEKVFSNFNKNLYDILDAIQFNSTNLIFEIIEIFVDNKELYSKCIVQLLERNHEEIATIFYNIDNSINKNPNYSKQALKELDALKKKIIQCQRLFDIPIVHETKTDLNLVKSRIKDFLINIKVKEMIIYNRLKKIDFTKKKERKKLEDLIKEYSLCKTINMKDKDELESIINPPNEAIDNEEKKAINFIKAFENMKDDQFEKFYFIFETYDKKELTSSDIRMELGKPDGGYNFLVNLCSEYQRYYEDIKEPCSKKDAMNKILVYLNHLKQKCQDKTPLFKNDNA